MSITYDIMESWANTTGNVNSNEDIIKWTKKLNDELRVRVEKVPFLYNGFWYYDAHDGYIRNKNNSFFQLAGYQEIEEDTIVGEQPIIIQNEIGYLGIICKKIDGVLNFLMQAKIEPGNINQIQISPTIQATKSNFTKMHGGASPKYLEYFREASKYTIICDQVQSEQSSRFYKKRNRNIVIYVEDDVEVYPSHKWMTIGQIKELLKIDNLVNMDTRTVLASIPIHANHLEEGEREKIESLFSDKALFHSIFSQNKIGTIPKIFNAINDCRMYGKENTRLIPLKSMKGWQLKEDCIECKTPYDFRVVYCKIEIEGREVKYWEQPLIEALGMAVFGIFTCVKDGVRHFLVKVKQEMGNYDSAELGPIVQMEPTNPRNELNSIEKLFMDKLERKEGILYDVILSEEGGRFYHEQNRNAIIEIDSNEIKDIPPGYFWVDFSEINQMVRYNNYLNIQLRNLISLLNM